MKSNINRVYSPRSRIRQKQTNHNQIQTQASDYTKSSNQLQKNIKKSQIFISNKIINNHHQQQYEQAKLIQIIQKLKKQNNELKKQLIQLRSNQFMKINSQKLMKLLQQNQIMKKQIIKLKKQIQYHKVQINCLQRFNQNLKQQFQSEMKEKVKNKTNINEEIRNNNKDRNYQKNQKKQRNQRNQRNQKKLQQNTQINYENKYDKKYEQKYERKHQKSKSNHYQIEKSNLLRYSSDKFLLRSSINDIQKLRIQQARKQHKNNNNNNNNKYHKDIQKQRQQNQYKNIIKKSRSTSGLMIFQDQYITAFKQNEGIKTSKRNR